jgi:hypothetical protein
MIRKYQDSHGRVFNEKAISNYALNNIERARELGYVAAGQPLSTAQHTHRRLCSIKTAFSIFH